MTFTRYADPVSFGAAVLDVLMADEVQNNLPISFIRNERGYDTSDWLLASVQDANGGVVLTAACTPPHNVILYETGNRPGEEALRLLSDELKIMGFAIPGVMAEQGLAYRFAALYAETGGFHRKETLTVMRLDRVNGIPKAPGGHRMARESDLYFLPYWERTFGEECNVGFTSVEAHAERIRPLLGKNAWFLWEDGCPVSQASNRRNTENGAVVTGVYTPPFYRGKGYASSVVAALSQHLLDRGSTFCCLFANAENPISCGIYRKMGYRDLCTYEVLKFSHRA
jgi:hypothetical protein